MKVHPRNEGSDTVDMILLAGMPIAIFVLTAVVVWLAMDLQNV